MRLLIILLLLSTSSYSQVGEVPVNQLDSNGERHGYWRIDLDSNLNYHQDSTSAYWYYYGLYYHGKELMVFPDDFMPDKPTKYPISIDRPTHHDGKLRPVHGTFMIRSDYGDFDKLVFNQGVLTHRLRVFTKYGDSWERFDYTTKYNGNPYSHYFEYPNPTGKKRVQGFVFGENQRTRVVKNKVPYLSDRYDADSSQVLFNGYYSGAFEYSSVIHSDSVYTSTTYGSSIPSNLILDTSTFFYEDFLVESYGTHNMVGKSMVEFKVDSIHKKTPFKEKYKSIILQGIYQVGKDKKKVTLTKTDEDVFIQYRFRKNSHNPYIFKEVYPKGAIRIIAK